MYGRRIKYIQITCSSFTGKHENILSIASFLLNIEFLAYSNSFKNLVTMKCWENQEGILLYVFKSIYALEIAMHFNIT